MARIVHNQTNFTAGELTPRMKGRGDVARYQNGAEVIENGVVVVHGGVMRRSGLRYLATTKLGATRKARLIRYVFNVEQSYCLEFGHKYVRVFDGATGAVLLNDSLAVLEMVSPYTDAQLAAITTKQSGDVMYLFHPDVAPQLLRRLTPTQWVLYAVPFGVQPFAELGHQPDAELTLSAATVGTGRTFTTNPTAVPGAPTIGTAYPLNAAASVNFTPPANTGGMPITLYTATSNPGGITGTGAASPVRVDGLTNGTPYTFTVTATNGVGTGAASAASNSVTPLSSLGGQPITVTSNPLNFSVSVENGEQLGIAGPTATGSAGTAPYAYLWKKISGGSGITITRSNTAQVLMKSTGFGAPNTAVLRCTATDALGSVGSVDVNVTVRHRHLTDFPSPGGVIP